MPRHAFRISDFKQIFQMIVRKNKVYFNEFIETPETATSSIS